MMTSDPAPVDGRQSETALRVARGTRRLLRANGMASVTELALPSGRRADIVALSGDGSLTIIEIKSSREDFRTDLKWPEYRAHCDYFYFAVPPEFAADLIPDAAGLIVADAYGAEILRAPEPHRLAAATRKVMLLRFGITAADRLHLLWDRDC